jgi:hypothetical protein
MAQPWSSVAPSGGVGWSAFWGREPPEHPGQRTEHLCCRTLARLASWGNLLNGLKLIGNLSAYMPEVIAERSVPHEHILRQLLSLTITSVPLGF